MADRDVDRDGEYVSLDWTDEAWRERWAKLARQREAERVEHQAEVDRWTSTESAPRPIGR